MGAYSLDLRQRVLADCDAGETTTPVAKKYGVSAAWVRGLKKKRRETGTITPGVPTGRPRQIDRDTLAALVRDDPDATLAQLQERLGTACGLSAIWMALDALKITFKKRRCGPPNRTAPTSPQRGPSGGSAKPGWRRKPSSLSMKRGRRPT